MLIQLQQHGTHVAGDRRVVGEDADDTGTPFDLHVDQLPQVGAPDLAPVGLREVAEGQHVFQALIHEPGGIGKAFRQRGGQIIPAVENIQAVSWANTERS